MHAPRNGGGWPATPAVLLACSIPALLALSASAMPVAPVSAPLDAPPAEEPRLVVLVVVDQLRADLLERHDRHFTGGLRRLLDEGFRFTDASHRHAVTESAPGHATLVTGVHPSEHGIVGNSWTEGTGDELTAVQATADPFARISGVPGAQGRSPAHLLREGFPDWLRARWPEARIVSISRKDPAAVLLAGTGGGHVYWLSVRDRRFVTSTRYREEPPAWVAEYNHTRMPVLTATPHWSDLPIPDRAAAELARTAIEALDLGGGPGPDYLAVSFSQADVIGHLHGPFSLEQRENLLHLDAVLGELLHVLDARVGPDRWVLAFSADHGVLDVPEELQARGETGRRLERDEVRLIRATARSARAGGRTAEDRGVRVALAMEEFDFIERAFWGEPTGADTIASFFRNSYRSDRSTGPLSGYEVMLHPTEGTMLAYREGRGSGHGTAHAYDRHVPLVFLGAGVPAGSSGEPVATVDLAPTLARLIGVPIPEGVSGRVLPFGRGGGADSGEVPPGDEPVRRGGLTIPEPRL